MRSADTKRGAVEHRCDRQKPSRLRGFLPPLRKLVNLLAPKNPSSPQSRRFTLNPVLVIISLVFWFWMWGIPDAILSVPMLAIAKIICDRVRPLAAFGHLAG